VLRNEGKGELVEKFSCFKNLKHSRVTPKAFSEKGLYMMSPILKKKICNSQQQ